MWLQGKGQSASWESGWDPDVIGFLPREILECEHAVGVAWLSKITVQQQFEAWKAQIGEPDALLLSVYNQREIVRLSPEFRSYIKEHQREALRFMWKYIFTPGEGGCLLAHGMGLGKTVDVIALLATYITTYKENRGVVKVLYKVPKNVMVSLKAELGKFDATFCEYKELHYAPQRIAPPPVLALPSAVKKRGRSAPVGVTDNKKQASAPPAVVSDTAETQEANKDKIRYYNFSKEVASSVTTAHTMIQTWNLLGGLLLLPDKQDVVEAFGRLAYAFGGNGTGGDGGAIKAGHAVRTKGDDDLSCFEQESVSVEDSVRVE